MTRPANENPELQGTKFYDTLYRDLDIEIPAETATDPYRFIPQSIMDQEKGRKNQTYGMGEKSLLYDLTSKVPCFASRS